MIEVTSNGALNIVVDSGRIESMHLGVSAGGPLDTLSYSMANLMVGNDQGAAAIEVTIFPFRLQFEVDTLVAVTGASGSTRINERPLPPYWCHWVRAGETLTINPPVKGARNYVAVAGGISAPEVLGSRSTDVRLGFGGVEGRGLKRGDKLSLDGCQSRSRRRPAGGSGFGVAPRAVRDLFSQLSNNTVQLRCVVAAEHARFSPEALKRYVETSYTVCPESNRMGYRLEGEKLNLTEPIELFSHGIVAGTVQVPPSGQPIIQLADANTCGGYPKIATVIEGDLWQLGQVRPGMQLRFQILDVNDALAVIRAQQRELSAVARNVELIAGRV
ncbi:biotin-dependent carboxyltransferase family protein [Paraburkholderia sp. BL21I4N1]|uniref:5-oxoprolinase subunit C family protein n=1 Tax=Paraburkholderia sp. BL21I4N1 TaxID=1938801 RepID=UPI000CFAE67A|nr:biotin-dependent carboxyltransferase family protein [Paraburkholderia sp. BL21I4N1]PQV43540.1 biotin-dependent carboxylase-like uncharacterized protein [Paraburkholderia sp. BL21I4N1]